MEFWRRHEILEAVELRLGGEGQETGDGCHQTRSHVSERVLRDVAQNMVCKFITTKWLDTNRGHECRPNSHSRLVGRKVKHAKGLDLFSARSRYCAPCVHVTRQGPKLRRIAVIPVEANLPRAIQRTWERETKVALASCSRAFTSLTQWRRTGHMSTPLPRWASSFQRAKNKCGEECSMRKTVRRHLTDIRFLVPGRNTTWLTSNQCNVRSTNSVGRP